MNTNPRSLVASLSLAAGCCIAGAAPASADDWVVYTFRGAATTVENPAGPWEGAQIGDRIKVVIYANLDAPPDGSTPTSDFYDMLPDFTAFQPELGSVGSTTVYYLAAPWGFDYGDAVIANDDGAAPAQDLFRSRWYTLDYGGAVVEFHETAPTAPVSTGLTGLAWPTADELELSTWARATLEIFGDFGTGPTVISGPIDTVMVQAPECYTIDFNEDGFIDFGDYLEFLNLYEVQDPRADLCGCGIVDFISFLIFLERYDLCAGL